MKEPDWEKYRSRSMNLTASEKRLQRVLDQELPGEIIDVHTHCNLADHVGELPPSTANLPMTTFAHYSLPEAQRTRRLLWSGRNVRSFRFANAFRGIDHKRANSYLLENCKLFGDEFVAYGLPDDLQYSTSLLRTPGCRALKVYHRYFDPPATSIAEILPDPLLAAASEAGIPVILHLPLPPSLSAAELTSVADRYPDLNVILAHIGTARSANDADLARLQSLAKYPRISLDTALVTNRTLLAKAISAFGYERVMFGSDEPLSLISAVPYSHRIKGGQWVSSLDYHWLDREDARDYKEFTKDEMLLHFSQLDALISAISDLFSGAQRCRVLVSIFAMNAKRIFGLAAS